MKLLLYFILFFTFLVPSVNAQSPTTSQIDELKNKVASKVAELKLVEKRGVTGIVTEASGTKISLKDLKGNIRIIDVDELTEFTDVDGKEIGLSDIDKGMQIGAIGLYNKESERLLARFIDEVKMPEFTVGGITKKDSESFEVTLATSDGKEYQISIEDITKTYAVTEDETLTRAGFSKIVIKKNAITIGFFDTKIKQKIIATRFFYFDNLPLDPKIEAIIPALDESSKNVTSTGSGKKLTPL